jgi:hypothetical protein
MLCAAGLCIGFALPACVKFRSAFHLSVDSWRLLTRPATGGQPPAN